MHAAFLLLLPPPARSPPPAPLSPRAFSHRAPARPVLPRPCRPESTCLTALQPAAPRSLRCMVRFSATSAAVPRAYTLTPQAASGVPLSTEPYSWHYSFSTARSAFASRVRAPQSTRETGTRRGPPPLPPPPPPLPTSGAPSALVPGAGGARPRPLLRRARSRCPCARLPSSVYPTDTPRYILADSLVLKWSLFIVHCWTISPRTHTHSHTHLRLCVTFTRALWALPRTTAPPARDESAPSAANFPSRFAGACALCASPEPQ